MMLNPALYITALLASIGGFALFGYIMFYMAQHGMLVLLTLFVGYQIFEWHSMNKRGLKVGDDKTTDYLIENYEPAYSIEYATVAMLGIFLYGNLTLPILCLLKVLSMKINIRFLKLMKD